ncbi:unnamed protein product [Didymodactylos carnosus]|uniref:Protein kinase domain-containing protein n=1 Tax=Didymodactylos carnosus TaxID=1234261 RepID=A0A815G7S2_9BILA|nr:unnamed protein product [Didymodactylos carnosus]CAF4191323.1 unnamed protein product [Didymodactylos carnosus]
MFVATACAVYRAHREGDDAEFAIKVAIWPVNEETGKMLMYRSAKDYQRELHMLYALKHENPHIVNVEGWGLTIKHNGYGQEVVFAYILTELAVHDVKKEMDMLAQEKAVSNANALVAGRSYTHGKDRRKMWRALLSCVEALHVRERPIVNTDIKPGNFLVFPKDRERYLKKKKELEPNNKLVKISDLGAGFLIDEGGEYTGYGTEGYSAAYWNKKSVLSCAVLDFLQTRLSRVELLDEMLLFINASRATSSPVSWFIYYMNVHPQIQAIMRQELNDHHITRETCLAMDLLDELVYIEYVMRELLRFATILHGILRTLQQNDEIDGVKLNKGDALLYQYQI